ncbi:MAG TPA: hypothetical protein VMN36_03265 [Verrucomicrobiales bacterium]|nr:hypothetical protein [Verrucomicrobiales bacterium]
MRIPGPLFAAAALTVLSLCSACPLSAQSAWLPAKGEWLVTPSFTYSTFDEFWVGESLVSPLKDNGEDLDQYSAFLAIEFGLTDNFAADVAFGYTVTSSTTTFDDGDDGFADTSFGLRYRFLNETEYLPSLTVRIGGIIAGTYDENTPFSAGDGADAFESSLLFAKSFGDSGFGAFGDIGYRFRESPVPDDIFGSIGLFKRFPEIYSSNDAITATIAYRHVESEDGLDIEGPGFNPAAGSAHGFPALREINQLLEGTLAYTDSGGRSYQVGIAASVDGRNTGDKLIAFFAITIPFGGQSGAPALQPSPEPVYWTK